MRKDRSDVPKMWEALPRELLVLWGRVVFMRHIFILNEIWAQDTLITSRLAPNYKHHILSPVIVSLRVNFNKHIEGGAS
jgi:hypothetical protein